MNPGIALLLSKHLGPNAHNQIDEQSFFFGAFVLKLELEDFINSQLQGERMGEFDMGQDDGLRWVLDHLRYIFKES